MLEDMVEINPAQAIVGGVSVLMTLLGLITFYRRGRYIRRLKTDLTKVTLNNDALATCGAKDLKEAKAKITELENSVRSLTVERDFVKIERDGAQRDRDTATARSRAAETNYNNLTQKLLSVEQERDQNRTVLNQHSTALATANSLLVSKDEAIARYVKLENEWKAQIDQLKDTHTKAIIALRAEFDSAKSEMKTANDKLILQLQTDLAAANTRASTDLAQLRKERDQWQSNYNSMNTSFQSEATNRSSYQTRASTLETQVNDWKNTNANTAKVCDNLRAELAAEKTLCATAKAAADKCREQLTEVTAQLNKAVSEAQAAALTRSSPKALPGESDLIAKLTAKIKAVKLAYRIASAQQQSGSTSVDVRQSLLLQDFRAALEVFAPTGDVIDWLSKLRQDSFDVLQA